MPASTPSFFGSVSFLSLPPQPITTRTATNFGSFAIDRSLIPRGRACNVATTPYGHVGSLLTMARKKISTTVYITPEQDAHLKALHDRTKVPVAEYIRQGIDLVLDKYRDQLPGQVDLRLGSR